MGEEFRPDWEEEELQEGIFVWPIYIRWAKLKDPGSDKPYVLIGAVVVEFPKGSAFEKPSNVGFEFDFRVYLSKAAKGFAMYFLKKFRYPENLIGDGKNPTIRTTEIAELWGQVLVEVAMTDTMQLRTNVMGYDYYDSTDGALFKLRDKKLEARGEAQQNATEPPARDLEEDVHGGAPPPREPGEDLDDDPLSGM